MSKKNILKGYDDYIEGKRTSKFSIILIVIFSAVVVLTTLILSFLANIQAIDQVQVIDSSGRVIQSENKRRNDVLISTAQQHISNAFYYLNTFDRATINENKARAYFLVEKKSADRVFSAYQNTGAYNDVIQNGYIYSAKFEKITVFEGSEEPFRFETIGTLTISEGNRQRTSTIKGSGYLRYMTPSYPTNPQGFVIVDYLQSYEE